MKRICQPSRGDLRMLKMTQTGDHMGYSVMGSEVAQQVSALVVLQEDLKFGS